MKNNIVKIKTYKGCGTGILYPCKYAAVEKGYSAYLVFTCAHVFQYQMEYFPNGVSDISKMVDLGIYDDFGNLVEQSEIKEVYCHIPKNSEDDLCDIALLLVQIKSTIRISPEIKIYWKELKNRDLLYVEGYPRVMLGDEINQKIQMEGIYKELFTEDSVVGMYQIRDDYHWYNDYQDLKLMEGFSGSPVYIERNDEIYLLGMNQSIANIDKGENPFKIVYYLKMQYILDCLRQSDCIIFRKNKNSDVDIEWVLGQAQNGKKVNLLMFGGSGAGKSSFVKTFAYHGNILKTTSDGQTTRTNIFYRFSLFPEKCEVSVQFFSKDDFIEKMKDKLCIRKWLCFLEDIAEIKGLKNDDEGCVFLKNIYPFFRKIKKLVRKNNDSKFNEMQNKMRKQARQIEEKISNILVESPDIKENSQKIYRKEISNCYEAVIKFLCTYIPVENWKYYFDIHVWESYRKNYDGIEESCPLNIKELYGYDWKTFLEKLAEIGIEGVVPHFEKDIRNLVFGDKFKKLYHSMSHIEGFFDLNEINFLNVEKSERWQQLMSKDVDGKYELLYTVKRTRDDLEKNNNNDKNNKQFVVGRDLDHICDYLYGVIYDCFMEQINGDTLKFNLAERISKEESEVMEKCFQATAKGALTVFVRNIIIEDKISDPYAWTIRRLNIKELNILDSCGFDHVKNNIDDVIKIKNILSEYREVLKEKWQSESKEQYAVLYLKKLDAGKPDELRNILPSIVRAIPKAPIYCVFTGIDFLYEQKNFCIEDLDWSSTDMRRVPKAVKYLLTDINQYNIEERKKNIEKKANEIFGGTDISENRKKHLYLVLKNNLIPFCGNKDYLDENFDLCESNQKYVEKLLLSVLVDEIGSMEIVDIDNYVFEDMEKEISNIIRLIFEKATVTKKRLDSIQYKIREADYNRLHMKGRELGYYSCVADIRLKWYQLFTDAYDKVIATESVTQEFISKFDKKDRAAIEDALLQMGEHYLFGYPYIFDQKELLKSQTKFRQELNKLFPEWDKLFESNGDEIKKDTSQIKEYLIECNNFSERYENYEHKSIFNSIFIDAMKKQISDSNSVKAEGLIQMNEEFEEALHKLEVLFATKYDDDKLLYTVLKEYTKQKK